MIFCATSCLLIYFRAKGENRERLKRGETWDRLRIAYTSCFYFVLPLSMRMSNDRYPIHKIKRILIEVDFHIFSPTYSLYPLSVHLLIQDK